jgi:hypothetical protein
MLDSKITGSDIRHIATNMRAADRREVEAASGLSPFHVLKAGIRTSALSGVGRSPAGEPVLILGVANVTPGVGSIWLLGTDGIITHKRLFHKVALKVLPLLHQEWPTLGNIVDARNTVHIRWLKALGFQFGKPIIAGAAKLPFIPFHRTVPNV